VHGLTLQVDPMVETPPARSVTPAVS
jgi:hypothetical protein